MRFFNKIAFIILSSFFLCISVFPAEQRKGADVLIKKIDATEVSGELIAVKTNGLLVLENKTGSDVSVPIQEILEVKIIKKSKVWSGVKIGFFSGLGAGFVYGILNPGDAESRYFYPPVYAAWLSLPGALAGLIISGILSNDISYEFHGRSDNEKKYNLKRLRSKARVKNFN